MSNQTLKFKTLGKSGFQMKPVLDRLRTFGLNKSDAFTYWKRIILWIQSNGVEWTVTRLKHLKAVYMAYFRKHPHPGYWISCSKDGYPKVFPNLRKYPIKVQLRVVNFYKSIVFGTITESQTTKFVDAVTRTLPSESACSRATDYVLRSTLPNLVRKMYPEDSVRPSSECAPYLSFDFSSEKTMPDAEGRIVSRIGINFLKSYLDMCKAMGGISLYCPSYSMKVSLLDFPNILEPVEWLGLNDSLFVDSKSGPVRTNLFKGPVKFVPVTDFVIGTIGMSQEGGGKLRCFANPNIVIQNALVPLYNELRDITKHYIYDCSLNQSVGHDRVRSFLTSQSEDIFYYDLSNATDTFPLTIQLDLLRHIGCDEDQLALFEFASRQKWKSPLGYLTWSVGQPLGLKPSFHAFSLCHTALIEGIFRSVYPKATGTFPFAVVGDDVVICDKEVATIYQDIMRSLDIQISDDKHSSGPRFVEFCGKIFDHGNTYHVGKTKRFSASSLMSLIVNYGHGATRELSRFLHGVYGIENPTAIAKGIISLPLPFGGGHGDSVPLRVRLEDPNIKPWLLALSKEFSSVFFKKVTSDELKLRQLAHSFVQNIPILTPISVSRFVSDPSHESKVWDTLNPFKEDRTFFSFPGTNISYLGDSDNFSYLHNVCNNIMRQPVMVESKISKVLRSIKGS